MALCCRPLEMAVWLFCSLAYRKWSVCSMLRRGFLCRGPCRLASLILAPGAVGPLAVAWAPVPDDWELGLVKGCVDSLSQQASVRHWGQASAAFPGARLSPRSWLDSGVRPWALPSDSPKSFPSLVEGKTGSVLTSFVLWKLSWTGRMSGPGSWGARFEDARWLLRGLACCPGSISVE